MIVVVGSVNMDAIVRVPRLPGTGETVLGDTLEWLPGGKGANQAVAAARLGAPTALVARVGDDDAGKTLRDVLHHDGVDVRSVKVTAEAGTGVALITVAPDGDNTIVVAPLANRRLAPADVDAGLVASASVVLCQLEVPADTVRRAFELARGAGVTTVLNPSPVEALDRPLLELTDVLVANEHEDAVIADPRPCPAVVVTRGAAGATVTFDGQSTDIPSPSVDAVDTTGAGDAFCGALVAGLARGLDVAAAARPAVAAGAITVTRPGALPSLPTASEVEAML